MTQMRKNIANSGAVNHIIENKIELAAKGGKKGKKLQAANLRELIAEYINTAVDDRGVSIPIREVLCPPAKEWGKHRGLLPEATRLRLLNPDRYPDGQSAIEGEFQKTKGDMLLPPAVLSKLTELSVRYSVWFPPHTPPANALNTKMLVSRGADTDRLIGCLVAPNTVLNSLQIAKVVPGNIGVSTRADIEAEGMVLGKLCPFGMPESVTFCVDSSVKALSEIAMNAGTPETMLVMPPHELSKLPQGVYFVPGLARVKETPA